MRGITRGVALVVCVAAGCGGRTSDDRVAGVEASRPLSSLSAAETQELCDWFLEDLGGDGARYDCGGRTVVLRAADFDCMGAFQGCSALVGDVRACADAQLAAFQSCDLTRPPQACERISTQCGGVDDSVMGGSSGSTSGTAPPLPASCVESQARSCTCADGQSGAQSCSGGTWGPCACSVHTEPGTCNPNGCPDTASGVGCCVTADGPCGQYVGQGCEPLSAGTCNPDFCPSIGAGAPCCVTSVGPCGVDVGQGCVPSCAPGEAQSCVCADGTPGTSLCAPDGSGWSPCACDVPAGSCNPVFCPSSGTGTPCCATPNGPCAIDVGYGCGVLPPASFIDGGGASDGGCDPGDAGVCGLL